MLKNTSTDIANVVLRDATTAVPLQYLSRFWRSLEILLINCKVELKLKWITHCVLTVLGNGNTSTNPDDTIFVIKDTKLYAPVITLAAKDNQNLSKLLSKEFERSILWNEYKTKSENTNTTNKCIYFLESNFVGVNRLFVLVYSNETNDAKKYSAKWYY